MDFVSGTIGLKITDPSSAAECIRILRKYDDGSIGELKHRIEHREYVYQCPYISHSGVRKLRRCYDKLTKAGITVEIYEHDDRTTREFLSNRIASHRASDREAASDAEAESSDP